MQCRGKIENLPNKSEESTSGGKRGGKFFDLFHLVSGTKRKKEAKGTEEGAKRRRSDVPQLRHFRVTVDPCHRVVAGSCRILDESEER